MEIINAIYFLVFTISISVLIHLYVYLPEVLSILVFFGLWKKRKIGVGNTGMVLNIAIPLVVYLIMRGDALFGYTYAKYMCSLKGDIVVHRTVDLSVDNWDKNGWPIYFDKKTKAFIAETFNGRFVYENDDYNVLYQRVVRVRLSVEDKVSGDTLASVSTFRPRKGWYERAMNSTFVSNNYCGTPGLYLDSKYSGGGPKNKENLFNLVFVEKDN